MAKDKGGHELNEGDVVVVQCSIERIDGDVLTLEPLIHGGSRLQFHLKAGSCESFSELLAQVGRDFEKRLELAMEEGRRQAGEELREKMAEILKTVPR